MKIAQILQLQYLPERSHKTIETKVFYYFHLMIEGPGSGSIPLTMDPNPDPEGPKTCGSGGSGFGTRSTTLVTRQGKHRLPGMHRLDAVNNLGPLNDHHWTNEKEHCCNPIEKDLWSALNKAVCAKFPRVCSYKLFLHQTRCWAGVKQLYLTQLQTLSVDSLFC